jgi:hypothetical protein
MGQIQTHVENSKSIGGFVWEEFTTYTDRNTYSKSTVLHLRFALIRVLTRINAIFV